MAHSVVSAPLVLSCPCIHFYGTIPNLVSYSWRVLSKVAAYFIQNRCMLIVLLYLYLRPGCDITGNLCRCTGYRPIIEGFQSLTPCAMGEKCCRNNKSNSNSSLVSDVVPSRYDPTQEPIFPPELKVSYVTVTHC